MSEEDEMRERFDDKNGRDGAKLGVYYFIPLPSFEERLWMEPSENERWLEIVITAKNHKRAREEAVLLATRKITSYFSIQE